MKKALFFVTILIMLYIVALSKGDFTVELQADDGISTEAKKMYRSNANNGITVLVKQEGTVNLFFQVTGNRSNECQMQVGNLRYSNDGKTSRLTLTLNQGSTTTLLGTVTTREAAGNGNLWNDFEDTGPIGDYMNTKEGLYNLVIEATKTDKYGLELDYVSLQILGCNNDTIYVSAVKSGYIQECANDPCKPWAIIAVVTNIIIGIIAFIALCVGLYKCCCKTQSSAEVKNYDNL